MNRASLANDIWRACDIMRRDDGTTGSLEYMEQLSWLLFLKVFEAIEDRLEVEAELDTPPRRYARIIDGPYRWSAWAHRDFPAEKLVTFIDSELFPHLRGLSAAGDLERRTIAGIFADIPGNRMKSPYNLRDVIAIVDEVDFQNRDDIYTVSRIASRKNVTRAELLPHEISYRGCLITAVSGRRGRPCVRTQTQLSLTA